MKWHIVHISCLICFSQWLQAQAMKTKICLDQEGFYPKAPKIAVFAAWPSVADGISEPVPGLLAGGPNPTGMHHWYTWPMHWNCLENNF